MVASAHWMLGETISDHHILHPLSLSPHPRILAVRPIFLAADCGHLATAPLLGILIIMSPAKPCTRAHCLYPSTTIISFLGTASVGALNLGIRICMETRRRLLLTTTSSSSDIRQSEHSSRNIAIKSSNFEASQRLHTFPDRDLFIAGDISCSTFTR